MRSGAHTVPMSTINPIPLMDATEITRRAVRGAGPGGRPEERRVRRARRGPRRQAGN
jgi:hypothetical protein